jgi:hypothetical protein
MPPDAAPELRLTPFYLNGGLVLFPRTVFDDVASRCLRMRPQLMSRMPDPDFTGQAALALAVAHITDGQGPGARSPLGGGHRTEP